LAREFAEVRAVELTTAAALKLAKRSTVTPVDDNQPTPSSAAQAARST